MDNADYQLRRLLGLPAHVGRWVAFEKMLGAVDVPLRGGISPGARAYLLEVGGIVAIQASTASQGEVRRVLGEDEAPWMTDLAETPPVPVAERDAVVRLLTGRSDQGDRAETAVGEFRRRLLDALQPSL